MLNSNRIAIVDAFKDFGKAAFAEATRKREVVVRNEAPAEFDKSDVRRHASYINAFCAHYDLCVSADDL